MSLPSETYSQEAETDGEVITTQGPKFMKYELNANFLSTQGRAVKSAWWSRMTHILMTVSWIMYK